MCNIKELKIASLHGHDDRSDGFNKTITNVEAAKEKHLYGLGVTNHGTCSGLIAHSTACEEHDMLPILGCEYYTRLPSELDERSNNSGSGRYHITFLSSGKQGYDRLIAINNDAHKNIEISRGAKYPIATWDMFKEHAGDGLIILTGCIASITFHDEKTIAYEYINFLVNTFGKNNVYAEVQPHVINRRGTEINSFARPLELAKKFDLKTVWTNDFHAATEEDLPLLQMYTKATKGYSFTAGYIQSAEEMYQEACSLIGEQDAWQAFLGIDEIVRRVESDGVMQFKHDFELPPADTLVTSLLSFWQDALESDINGN